MSEHYIVTLDHGHLKIYARREVPGQFTPGLQQVEAIDFPAGKHSYTERESDEAGRFSGSRNQGSGVGAPAVRAGMSIDERLPMQREESRRRVRDLATQIEQFFQPRPDASWDYAAGPELNGTVLELLSPELRRRMRRCVPKDLVNQRIDEVRAHFAAT